MQAIIDFLGVETPAAWVTFAVRNIDLLLVDHAHCEKKAASSALKLVFRYPEQLTLIQQASRFAREEMRHFEQVLALMTQLGVTYKNMSPSRYAGQLQRLVREAEPDRLIDLLIMSAFIEARSCERFAKLVPHLQGKLKDFYHGLLNAEKRHFTTYLSHAERLAGKEALAIRVSEFSHVESALMTEPDKRFRFHSGVPV